MPRIFAGGTSNLVRMGNMGHRHRALRWLGLSSPPLSSPSLASLLHPPRSLSTGLYSYVPTVFLGVPRSRNTRRAIIFPSANKFTAVLEHTAVERLSSRAIVLPAMSQFRETTATGKRAIIGASFQRRGSVTRLVLSSSCSSSPSHPYPLSFSLLSEYTDYPNVQCIH